jgi:hypothetical protein
MIKHRALCFSVLSLAMCGFTYAQSTPQYLPANGATSTGTGTSNVTTFPGSLAAGTSVAAPLLRLSGSGCGTGSYAKADGTGCGAPPTLIPAGAYNAGTTYTVGQMVSYSGANWACNSTCLAVTPATGAYWTSLGTNPAVTTNTPSTTVGRDGSGDFSTQQITLGADPTSALQTVTKEYSDSSVASAGASTVYGITTPVSASTFSTGYSYTTSPAVPSTGTITAVQVYARSTGTIIVYTAQLNSTNNLTLLTQLAPLTVSSTGLVTFTGLNLPISSGQYVGFYSSSAMFDTASGSSIQGWYVSGLLGTAQAVTQDNNQLEANYTLSIPLAPTVAGHTTTLSTHAAAISTLQGFVGMNSTYGVATPATGSTFSGGYSFVSNIPVATSGTIISAQIYAGAANSVTVFTATLNSTNNMTLVNSQATATLAVGLNTVTLSIPVTAGQYVGVYAASSTLKYISGSSPVGWYVNSLVGTGTAMTGTYNNQVQYNWTVQVSTSNFAALNTVVAPSSQLIAIGNSLTAGTGSTGGNTYPAQLSTLLSGRSVTNTGIGGQTQPGILMQFGSYPILLTLPSNQVQASGSVSITMNGGVSPIIWDGNSTLTGTVAGVPVTLAYSYYTAPLSGGTITNGGTSCTSGSVTFSSGAAAATTVVSSGIVTGFSFSNFGSYASNALPTMTLPTCSGTQATATAAQNPGELTPVTMTLARTTAGSAVPVYGTSEYGPTASAAVPFIVTSPNYTGDTVIFWTGRNSLGLQEVTGMSSAQQLAAYQANMTAAVAWITAHGKFKHFLILSETNRSDEYNGSTTTASGAALNGSQSYALIVSINAWLQATWPANYVEVREAVVAGYNSGSPSDVTAFGLDTMPPSLMETGSVLHLNNSGYAIVAAQVAAAITSLNY